MEEGLLMQGFYHGLTQKAREHLDTTAEGSFLSFTVGKASYLWRRYQKIKAGPKTTLNIVIRVKKRLKK
jgi:hypothetical protein